jgi:hypothetical protein
MKDWEGNKIIMMEKFKFTFQMRKLSLLFMMFSVQILLLLKGDPVGSI